MTTNEQQQHIYTDGAAPTNGNCVQGGVGVAIYDACYQLIDTHKETIRLFGATTTNVRCEMLALISGLKRSSGNDVIYTDSEMSVKGYNEWLDGWKRRGWRKANKKPVLNVDLWKQIDELRQDKPDVIVEWVKGHNSIEGNELADRLASEAAKGK